MYNKDTLALINAKTGTAVKDGDNYGRWIIPDENSPNIIQSAPEVLGLRLLDEQLWKNNGSHLTNFRKSYLLDLLDEQLWKTTFMDTSDISEFILPCVEGCLLGKDFSLLALHSAVIHIKDQHSFIFSTTHF